jgi:hypothetical protein
MHIGRKCTNFRADERRAAAFDCVPAVITRLTPGAASLYI